MLAEGELNPVQALIARRGGVRFRDFMEMALYHPEHGYYGAGRAALGRGGDFFTNVSVGRIFGELLGAQFVEMWYLLGCPDGFTIVEQGAHDGTFAADVLGWCSEAAPEFFRKTRYVIVEGLEIWRGRQGERLERYGEKVVWRERLEEVPRFTGVHFSNELVDALPVHVVRWRQAGWREMYVTPELEWREEGLEEHALLERLADVPRIEGYTTEVNLNAARWAGALAARIERGWVVAIDYGFPRAMYYAPERRTGTLECFSGHRKGLNPLENPGFRDLTAHVEFTSLARAFLDAGMEVAGYADQHHFLTGLVSRAFAERVPTPQEARGLKTLLHPEMLGRAFQVLGMGRDVSGLGLAGFQFARDGERELGL